MTGPLESNGFPDGTPDEIELYLRWLGFLRGAVLRKALGLTDEQARWHPEGKLLPLIGIVNHLTGVETRWIDGEMLGRPTSKPADEYEPGAGLTIDEAVAAYRRRATATDKAVREIADPTTPTNPHADDHNNDDHRSGNDSNHHGAHSNRDGDNSHDGNGHDSTHSAHSNDGDGDNSHDGNGNDSSHHSAHSNGDDGDGDGDNHHGDDGNDGLDLRFVLVHLINETARHAGHADATRELLDGVTGE